MEFYKNLFSLLKVLKGIAVSQFHILERKIRSFEAFYSKVENFLEEIDTTTITHPFVTPQSNVQGIITITSDSGLLGGLNMQVMRSAFGQLTSKRDVLMIVGERGKIYAQEARIPFVGFPSVREEQRMRLALTVRDYIFERVLKKEIGIVKIIYPKAFSLMVQKIAEFPLLPYGKRDRAESTHLINFEEYIRESSIGDIVEYLVYLWMGHKMFDILQQAKLAELGARFVHLEESSQKLEDLNKELRLKYLRIRHELTDRSMRELFAARLIYGHTR
ncbi:MAG: F0F1 ATP synthase subunit gamma [Candidatus Omnitrophota bacterium]|nr:MAG: F0F1 ATP synthase subunit gamma [Candidatus Omnitrophota bacterium]